MRKRQASAIAVPIVMAAVLGTVSGWASGQQGTTPAVLHVSSLSFADGQTMPQKLTCDGADQSPSLQWLTPPAGTQSYVIVMHDPDAPVDFTHWLAYNIPGMTYALPEGASTPSQRLDHAVEGINSFGRIGYGGPCPPTGKPHHYVFRVYALDVNPGLPAGQGTDQVMAAIKGHVLAEGEITGMYERGGM
ncbi:YbhB/YbcL family Raf kinase inhibitor-like protein [Dyella caseinilytica]|nr:YbhB/YbcL family Raf kinase inhibitor-like protein [Dyella caseinilytica]